MPYVELEKKIMTKVIGIASKIDDNDTLGVRQVVLEEMAEDPSIVSLIFLKGTEVWVSLENGREFYLGDVRAKYERLILDNQTRITSWQITGGAEIPNKTICIAGQDTNQKVYGRGKRGMNIHIELS